jgi:uncharacterized protein (TIGR03663 family)
MNDTGLMARGRDPTERLHSGHDAVTKTGFAALVGLALVLALGLRIVSLDRRPMHHDEANQAVKFGRLLETGRYEYDPADHHGPTLYYLTLPAAWVRGQATLAALDERTLRIVPACFGVALPLLFLTLRRRLGRAAVASAMLLAALSPALVYYSRFYIQESIFAFLGVACLIATGRYRDRPSLAAAAVAGACAGLAYATKETSVIVVPAAVVAVAVAHHWTGPGRRQPAARVMDERGGPPVRHGIAGAAGALGVAWLFFSSFFTHQAGFIDSIRAFRVFVERGTGTGAHVQPWHYYLQLLGWSSSGGVLWTEAAVLALACFGLVAAGGRTGTFWKRAIAIYAVVTTAAFSALAYKTPWNILPFHAGIVLLAGIGVDALWQWGWRRRGPIPLALAVLFCAACAHLGWQSWRAIDRFAADPRNPYVYAHTSPDLLRLVQRVKDLSALDPDGKRMLIKVVAGPYEQWPLPWYLRGMERVGYWPRAAEAEPLGGTPVIIASQDNAAAVEAALDDRVVSEMYGLRPGVFLTLLIERSRWERFLAAR